jgi:hypothetical protein
MKDGQDAKFSQSIQVMRCWLRFGPLYTAAGLTTSIPFCIFVKTSWRTSTREDEATEAFKVPAGALNSPGVVATAGREGD